MRWGAGTIRHRAKDKGRATTVSGRVVIIIADCDCRVSSKGSPKKVTARGVMTKSIQEKAGIGNGTGENGGEGRQGML